MDNSISAAGPAGLKAAAADGPYRLRWVVAFVVLAANVMDVMDATIVNVAGPSIHRDLHGGTSTLQWLSAGYTLAFAVLLIAGARLGDIFGRRRLFLIGSAGFTFFSAACAAAPSMTVLIACRALQGAFGALMIPQGFGLIKEVFSDDELPKVMGLMGPATGLPILLAPVLAGVLVDADLWGTGWRLVFLINVPVGLFSFVAALRSLPHGASHPDVRLDTRGVVLIGVALTAIIYPLIQGRSAGWPLYMFVILAVGVVLLAIFVLNELRGGQNALVEPALLRNRTYLRGIAVILAFFGAFSGILLCVSLYGQLGEHWSPIHAGLALTPMVIGMIVGMTASMGLVSRFGRHLLHIGIGLVIVGFVVIALAVTGVRTASTWDLVPGLVILGAGAGMSFGQLFSFILTSVGMDEVGSASGVMEAVQQLSTALGVAVLGTIFFSVFGSHLPTDALQITAWASLAPAAIAFVLVFGLPMHARVEAEA
jgi:EmrB/QacA subfamily drug resistance transporter